MTYKAYINKHSLSKVISLSLTFVWNFPDKDDIRKELGIDLGCSSGPENYLKSVWRGLLEIQDELKVDDELLKKIHASWGGLISREGIYTGENYSLDQVFSEDSAFTIWGSFCLRSAVVRLSASNLNTVDSTFSLGYKL